MKRKALALLSGGLDSTLAVKSMLEQKIDVVAINFITPFCNCTSHGSGCKHQATKVAEELGVEIKVFFKGLEYVEIIKNPKHGYGRNMNPCLDCRIFMHKEVKNLMEELDASFIVTGEVIGQRPMSQMRDRLDKIERESGLEGLILRPLSAKLLPPTIPELEGIVDREKLLSINGRSRKIQIEMADQYKLNGYLCAAGGCLLTDNNYARRLKDLFTHNNNYNLADIKLLRIGRHFRLNERTKVILGRNSEDNDALMNFGRGSDCQIVSPDNFNGPFALIKGEIDNDAINMCGGLIGYYSKKTSEEKMVTYDREGTKEIIKISENIDEQKKDKLVI